MLGLLLLAALTIIPFEAAITDHVETIEHNHFYDEHGKHVFDQHIFRSEDEIIDWRLAKATTQAVYADRGAYRLDWCDGNCIRTVWAARYIETWKQYDPELVEREQLPKEERRGLSDSLRRELSGRGEKR